MRHKPSVLAAALLLMASAALAAVPAAPHDFSPQGIIERRVSLYIESAHTPLEKMAPAVYAFAADAERCRMASGAEACGLSAGPLQGSSLKQIFDYYVAQPVEAGRARQKVGAEKSHWTWQAQAGPAK